MQIPPFIRFHTPQIFFVIALLPLSLFITLTDTRAAQFIPLGDLPGGEFISGARGVSADGSVVVGTGYSETQQSEPFIWTLEDGMQSLGDLPGGFSTGSAFDVSSNGSTIVGGSGSAMGRFAEAYIWTRQGGMVPLGDLPGGSFFSNAYAVSADGTVVIGDGSNEESGAAFRWTSQTGMVDLGTLPGSRFSHGRDVSADGNVVVGNSGSLAFLWTEEAGMLSLGGFQSVNEGTLFANSASAISADGTTVVGKTLTSDVLNQHQAYRWTSESGMIALGDLPGGSVDSQALDVSGDGSIVVGISEAGSLRMHGFIWHELTGMLDFKMLLMEQGVEMDLDDWEIHYLSSISHDGRTIAGAAFNPDGNPEAFLAQIDPFIPLGDADLDGDVDGFDLLIYQANFGLTHTSGPTLADFNSDGATNATDYQIWQATFGTTSPSPDATFVPVPEPTTLSLTSLLLFSISKRHRPSRHA